MSEGPQYTSCVEAADFSPPSTAILVTLGALIVVGGIAALFSRRDRRVDRHRLARAAVALRAGFHAQRQADLPAPNIGGLQLRGRGQHDLRDRRGRGHGRRRRRQEPDRRRRQRLCDERDPSAVQHARLRGEQCRDQHCGDSRVRSRTRTTTIAAAPRSPRAICFTASFRRPSPRTEN